MKNIAAFIGITLLSTGMYAQGWSEMGIGLAGLNANGQILSLQGDNTGKLYVAGAFVFSGARNVYAWGTTHWEQVGAMNADLWYASMCKDAADNIYTGGSFSNTSGYRYVAKWNGTAWSQLGVSGGALNANDIIWKVAANAAGNIFAAGDFTNAAGYTYVARWSGASWTELGAGSGALNGNNTIQAICADAAGNVYAGGAFTEAGQYYVAMWSPITNAWTRISPYLNGPVNAMCTDADGYVYVAGAFQNSAGYNYVGKWDGAFWSELSTGLYQSGNIWTIAAGRNGQLFAAGIFTPYTGLQQVYYWDGTTWGQMGTDALLNANSSIFTLYADTLNNQVYAAGNFTNAAGRYYVAKCAMPPAPSPAGVAHTSAISVPSVYPNPADDRLTIDVAAWRVQDASVTVSDMAGRVLISDSWSGSVYTISTARLPQGVYVAQITSGSHIYTTRFVRR